jgi:hypothetical protein
MVAHAIAGSWLWSVKPEPQRAPSDAIAESAETSPAETVFKEQRRKMLGLLGVNPDLPLAVGGHNFDTDLSGIFARLLVLTDEEVMAILAVVMGETLAAGHPIVGSVGAHLGTRYWQADPAFLDLVLDREALTAMLDEVAEPGVCQGQGQGAQVGALRLSHWPQRPDQGGGLGGALAALPGKLLHRAGKRSLVRMTGLADTSDLTN